MRANPVFLALLLLFAAGTADAQLYKWVDADGKVRYGDTPPPGVTTSSIKAPPSGAAPVSAPDAKGAKAPATEAEREQAFRKRQADAAKASEKADSEQRAKAEQADNCARMQENLRSLEAGQRIMRVNAAGERYYLDDAQMAQEAASVRKSMQQVCK